MKKKLSLKKINRMYFILWGGGVLILVLSLPFLETIVWIGYVMMAIGGIMVMASSIVNLKLYRCPVCDEPLQMSIGVPEYCPSCGAHIQEFDDVL